MLANVKNSISSRERFTQSLQEFAAQLVGQHSPNIDVQFDLNFWQAESESYVPVEIGLWLKIGRKRRLIIVEGWQRNQAVNAMFVRAVAEKRTISRADQAIIIARTVPTRAAINVARDLGVHILIWKQARTPP